MARSIQNAFLASTTSSRKIPVRLMRSTGSGEPYKYNWETCPDGKWRSTGLGGSTVRAAVEMAKDYWCLPAVWMIYGTSFPDHKYNPQEV